MVITAAEWLPLPPGVVARRQRFGSNTQNPLPAAARPPAGGVLPGPHSIPAVEAPPAGAAGGAPGPPPPPGSGEPTDGYVCQGECNSVLVVAGTQEGASLEALNVHPGVCQVAVLAAAGGPPASDDAEVWETFQIDSELRVRGPLATLPEHCRFVRYRWYARMLYGASGWDNRIALPRCMLMQAAYDYPNRLGTGYGWATEEARFDVQGGDPA